MKGYMVDLTKPSLASLDSICTYLFPPLRPKTFPIPPFRSLGNPPLLPRTINFLLLAASWPGCCIIEQRRLVIILLWLEQFIDDR